MPEKGKTEMTMLAFEEYERRFARARLERPLRRAWIEEEREDIIRTVKDVLGYRDDWLPAVRVRSERELPGKGYTIRDYTYETWDRFYGVSSLYCPDGVKAGEKRPLVFVCPGHGAQGRRTPGYQQMAIRLARQGACALLIDNIGQGDRAAFGHKDCAAPFACGLTLQGMILMETVALIRWAKDLPHVDAARMGACGNSGGGTLTCFLAALAPELSAIASSGYPGDFDFVLQKEKPHCCCNLLPHVLSRLDMWQVYSAFAPRPLLLEQGSLDNLIPCDLFYRIARKVGQAYAMAGSPDAFEYYVSRVGHSWEAEDRDRITAFLGRALQMPSCRSEDAASEDIRPGDAPSVDFPADAITTDEAAMRLSGVRVDPGIRLEDIFPPMYRGRRLEPGETLEKNVRGDVMRVLSQFELSL